jgi:uncharacterized protein
MEETVQKVLDMLLLENWADLRRQFNPILQFILPETLLSKGWSVLTITHGPLRNFGAPIISSGWWFTSAKVPVHFARGNLAMTMTLTPYGGLVGLRLIPLSLAGFGEAWKQPSYSIDCRSRSEDLQLGSKYKVSGLLTLPEHPGLYPVVILLAGSGPCDRDSTVGAKKPFADLALGLAASGVASIRFDKVTLTHGSRLNNSTSITLTDEYMDQALDAIFVALNHVEIDKDSIYVLGHSLGGIVAPRMALTNSSVRGCIVMAGPVDPIYRAYIRQLRYLGSLSGELSDAAKQAIEEAVSAADRADSPELNLRTKASTLPFGLPASYWLDCREFLPTNTLVGFKKPIFVLQGSRDYQVSPLDDYSKWVSALEQNENAKLRLYDKLDHTFCAGKDASTPADYDVAGNVEEAVVRDIAQWIQSSP